MRSILAFLVAIGLCSPTHVLAQSSKLTVNVYNIRSDSGKLYLSLYNSDKGYPKKASDAYRLAFSEIHHGKCTIVLDGLPSGTYAVACYHDENNNGKIDTNFFGVPTEGTGASNDAKGSMGPPKFKDAKFNIDRDTTINIKINY